MKGIKKPNFREYEERRSKAEKIRTNQKKIKIKEMRRKNLRVRKKVGKSQKNVFSGYLWLLKSKSRFTKQADAEPVGQIRNEKV